MVAICCWWAATLCAQTDELPAFSGRWELVAEQSQFASAHPPVSGISNISYDGTHWRLESACTGADGSVIRRATVVTVDSPRPNIAKSGTAEQRSRMHRDGDAMVLDEEITAADGHTAKSSVRYSLEQDGQTLIALEEQHTSSGAETNRWVFHRAPGVGIDTAIHASH